MFFQHSLTQYGYGLSGPNILATFRASCTVGATALYSLGHEGGKRQAQPAEQEQELQKEPLCKP